jgi:hypothetical protein
MHNKTVELQGKCRRLFYYKTDQAPFTDADGVTTQKLAGDVLGVAFAGGSLDGVSGDDLIIATFNDQSAPDRIGCVEEFYSPIPASKPVRIDLTKVAACGTAVDNHRTAKQAESDFVFEKGIKLFGSEYATTEAFRHVLKFQEMYSRDDPDRVSDHETIVQAQADLEALCKTCDDCCEQLLETRDAAVVFQANTGG